MTTVSDRLRRRRLVSALRANGTLRSPRVIAALSAVPRSRFVPDGVSAEDAYADHALVLTADSAGKPTSTISQPSMVALMLEQLHAQPGHRVLEVGTASGYTAALLAGLVRPSGSVVTIELDPHLGEAAAGRLAARWPEVSVQAGDGWCGAPDAAPFDRIHVTVGVDDLSPHWLDQLGEGGVLVAPIMLRPGVEVSVAFERRGDELVSRSVRPCGFVRLRGPHAGPSTFVTLGETDRVLADWADEPLAQHLREVLARAPVDAGPVGPLAEGWAALLALEQPYPLAVATGEPPPGAVRPGLYDPVGGGVAVVDEGRLLSYGDQGAVRRLGDQIAGGAPLRQPQLHVTARPRDGAFRDDAFRDGAFRDDEPAAARWTVHKQHFSFRINPG
ncbi:MAG TPA: protein-L-isoaspartate(D-aspartate) O-methyltransferase [Pseudonocardiaceae bacterium]|jgi:protein-L-isoaspartate(D-aspartate) O-methyltransferase